MAFSEFEEKRLTKVVGSFIEKRRPPAHIRAEVDLMFSIEGQSVVLLEKRRLMDGEVIERPFAKATWVRTQEVWRLYWQRADLKWHGMAISLWPLFHRSRLSAKPWMKILTVVFGDDRINDTNRGASSSLPRLLHRSSTNLSLARRLSTRPRLIVRFLMLKRERC